MRTKIEISLIIFCVVLSLLVTDCVAFEIRLNFHSLICSLSSNFIDNNWFGARTKKVLSHVIVSTTFCNYSIKWRNYVIVLSTSTNRTNKNVFFFTTKHANASIFMVKETVSIHRYFECIYTICTCCFQSFVKNHPRLLATTSRRPA